MSFAVDPFTQVYRKLWETLLAEPEVKRRVRPGNRIDYATDDRDPEGSRGGLTDAFPEMRIKPTGGPFKLFGSNTHSFAIKTFNIEIETGDMRVHREMFPLEWAIFKALSKTQDSNLGLPFVMNVTYESVNDLDTAPDGRVLNQWATLIAVTVEMVFDTAADLQS